MQIFLIDYPKLEAKKMKKTTLVIICQIIAVLAQELKISTELKKR